MEDSVKGIIVAFTLGSLVIMGLLNFLYYFPTEQGVDLSSDSDYLSLSTMKDIDISGNLSDVGNVTSTGFDKWDIEVGFMGSNTMKGSASSITGYKDTFINRVTVLAEQVFTTKEGIHPVLYVLGVLGTTLGIYIMYLIIKMLRTGN